MNYLIIVTFLWTKTNHFIFFCNISFIENVPLPGRTQAFSSYPGTIFSGDDFYILSSGLVRDYFWLYKRSLFNYWLYHLILLQVTLETTIGNSNPALWKNVNPVGTVSEWLRNIVANRLATNGLEWAEIFRRNNSGTWVFKTEINVFSLPLCWVAAELFDRCQCLWSPSVFNYGLKQTSNWIQLQYVCKYCRNFPKVQLAGLKSLASCKWTEPGLK